jgi:outer membrane protein assembly factor BamB
MLVLATLLCSLQGATSPVDAQPQDNWPQWRGPLFTGVAPHADPPLEWSESANVRWKTAIPGKGHSTPVVWGDRVFLTTAIPVGDAFEPRIDDAPGTHDSIPVTQSHRFVALALDRANGKILWQVVLKEAIPHEGGHYTGSYASPSPVTDGEHWYAYFGSRGLHCLDRDGNVIWQQDLGELHTYHNHGEGSSPALYGETIVVDRDQEGASCLVALDKDTGEVRWKVPRDEATTWSTPIVVEYAGKAQLVTSGTNRVRSYDLETGELLWECAGLSHNVVASPVAGDGMVFAASSYEKQAMLAIRLEGAKGDLSDSDHIVWVRHRSTPYVPSPLLYDGALYFLNHYQGFLSRVIASTGEEPERALRLEGADDIYASPVAAAGRVYVTDRSGLTYVVSSGAHPQILARNRLDETFSASAALAGNELFLRGENFLYCLSQPTGSR